jgi:hypothetical protein
MAASSFSFFFCCSSENRRRALAKALSGEGAVGVAAEGRGSTGTTGRGTGREGSALGGGEGCCWDGMTVCELKIRTLKEGRKEQRNKGVMVLK